MREIVTKYESTCGKCGTKLPVSTRCLYRKHAGVFCLTCEPTQDELREMLQESADRKAERLDGWAEKRRTKAADLERANDPYRGDHAFNTQPGHIPERVRAIRRTKKAWEHSSKAAEMEAKASGLRSGVRLKGDREREREAKREKVRQWIKPGMHVKTPIWGTALVKRVNLKTATLSETGQSGTYEVKEDLAWLSPVEAD